MVSPVASAHAVPTRLALGTAPRHAPDVRWKPAMPATTSATPSVPSGERRSSKTTSARTGTSATPSPRAIG